jgi:hypothetical protein
MLPGVMGSLVFIATVVPTKLSGGGCSDDFNHRTVYKHKLVAGNSPDLPAPITRWLMSAFLKKQP